MYTKLSGILCIILIFALILTGCGSGNTSSAVNSGETVSPDSKTLVNSREAVTVTENVTVEFWHTCSGALGEMLEAQINKFNTSNTMGVTVVGTYKGGSGDLMDLVKKNYGTNDVPDMLVTGGGGTETLAAAGVLVDMAAYVKRDNFDMSDIPQSIRYYSEYFPGQIVQFPYQVNASIIYYNKAYYPDGFPTTLEDWINAAQKISAETPGVYGMGIPPDTGYTLRPLIRSLGSPGFSTQDGTVAGCLEDGSLEKMMTDWLSWIDGSYCIGINNTDVTASFMKGEVAAFPISCVNTVDYAQRTEQAGIELGYAPCVGYGGYAGGLGGSGICLLDSSTDQELAACWEFIKFLYEDEQIIEGTITGGFVPLTYSSTKSQQIQDFWAEYPGNRVAFEALENATYNEWSPNMVQWRNEIRAMLLEVVSNRTLTPAEAIRQLERRAPVVLG